MRLVVLVAAAAGAAALAAVALATVTVYSNDFSSRTAAKEIKGPKPKACDRVWRKRSEKLRITVKNGPRACLYTVPVEGVSAQPDHDLRFKGKVLKDTPRGIRDTAYLAVMVRSGGGKSYELRVFPRERRFSVLREPDSGAFPESGTNAAIRMAKRNVIRLQIFGAKVRAIVNGTELAEINDPNPADVPGKRLRFVVGNTGDTSKDTIALLDDVKVAVPNP